MGTKNIKKEITLKILLGNPKLFASLVTGIGLLIADYFLQYGILSAFAFPILYNWMDLTGFRNIIKDGIEEIMKKFVGITKEEYTQILQGYRVLQHTIEGLLFITIGLSVGWLWAALGLLLKFTSSADILYHWIGKYPFDRVWPYQEWTIAGWLPWKKVIIAGEERKAVPRWAVYTQCVIGIATVLAWGFYVI